MKLIYHAVIYGILSILDALSLFSYSDEGEGSQDMLREVLRKSNN